ncbi:MAG: efflux RND transporter periplasmic adaptor subunit [Desulfobacterales bacterium]
MNRQIRIVSHAVLAAAVLGAGIAGFYLLKSVREAPQRHQIEEPLPIVRTVPVTIKDMNMTITADGTVNPVSETRIVPRVGGKVIRVSDELVNGGVFKKGELMLEVEPDDYEIALTLARAGLREAESSYQTALQESRAAVNEWEKLHPDTEPPDLVARMPQLQAALANKEAREADMSKARLNLERTKIHAPFDCRVSQKQVDLGEYVSVGQALATLYSTEAVEIVVPVENRDLVWFDIPGFTSKEDKGSSAKVFADVAGRKCTWQGEVIRTQGKIDEKTRMVNVVIRVPGPYETIPPLVPGQFAEVEIYGRTIRDAAVIPRAALQEENTVWAVDPNLGRLYIREVDVAYMGLQGVVVQDGLEEGEFVAVSPVKGVTDGMEVKAVNTGRGDGS